MRKVAVLCGVITLSLALAGVLLGPAGRRWARTDDGAAAQQGAAAERRPSTTTAPATSLGTTFQLLERREQEAPRDRWDPDYIVHEIGSDPDALFRWVRDNTFWIPYRGLLRGPVGVLLDRQGNSLDRAVLLATLLEHAGRTVRLAHGTLPREQAAAVLTDMEAVAQTGPDLAPVSAASDVSRLTVEHGLDTPELESAVTGQSDIVKRLVSTLDTRVHDQTARLLAAIPESAVPAERRRSRQERWDSLLTTSCVAWSAFSKPRKTICMHPTSPSCSSTGCWHSTRLSSRS